MSGQFRGLFHRHSFCGVGDMCVGIRPGSMLVGITNWCSGQFSLLQLVPQQIFSLPDHFPCLLFLNRKEIIICRIFAFQNKTMITKIPRHSKSCFVSHFNAAVHLIIIKSLTAKTCCCVFEWLLSLPKTKESGG